MDDSLSGDFEWQPVDSVDELAEHIDREEMLDGLRMADQVKFWAIYPGLYKAVVDGTTVSYDGEHFPGGSMCGCDAVGVASIWCRHMAAVGLVVLGRGRVPEGAEEAILNYEKVYTDEEWEEMKNEGFAAPRRGGCQPDDPHQVRRLEEALGDQARVRGGTASCASPPGTAPGIRRHPPPAATRTCRPGRCR